MGLQLSIAALVKAGYGSVTEIEALDFADLLRYIATLHHDIAEERKALKRARK